MFKSSQLSKTNGLLYKYFERVVGYVVENVLYFLNSKYVSIILYYFVEFYRNLMKLLFKLTYIIQ